MVLRRLLQGSGTGGRRKDIGLCLCPYCCFQCLGRSLIALADGKTRKTRGRHRGRQTDGTNAGQAGALWETPSMHRETAERSVILTVL